jgi:hypothetical protein
MRSFVGCGAAVGGCRLARQGLDPIGDGCQAAIERHGTSSDDRRMAIREPIHGFVGAIFLEGFSVVYHGQGWHAGPAPDHGEMRMDLQCRRRLQKAW